MKKIAIYGAGGFGREVLMLIRQINLISAEWDIIGFFDDVLSKDDVVNGIAILGGIEVLNEWDEELNVVLAIGQTKAKGEVFKSISNERIRYPKLIHPGVQIEKFQSVSIGEGAIICAGNILTVDISIGNHVILNLGCTVGHDVKIGDFSSIMPGCHISGEVSIGEGCYLGTGAVVINDIAIGDYATIGAGAVVINDIETDTTVVGVPAKPKK